MSTSVNAADGIRWPSPIVAVSKEEQRPWCFGWHAYADRTTDRSIVASSEADANSPTVARFGEPFALESHDLHTADYWLMGPDGPIDGFVGIERKERDLASSLTAEMGRFKEECDRLRTFTNPLIVTSCTLEDLCSAHPRHEPAFVGGMAAIAARYRIPIVPMPDRAWAERFAASFLVECWRAMLTANPHVLEWAREQEAARGLVRERKRGGKRPADASVPPGLAPAGGARASSTGAEQEARRATR